LSVVANIFRGLPIVRATEDKTAENKAKRENATSDALAKAKAMVDAENKKQAEKQGGADTVGNSEHEGRTNTRTKAADVVPESAKAETEEVASKKRGRDDINGDGERQAKRVDKSEAVEVVNGGS